MIPLWGPKIKLVATWNVKKLLKAPFKNKAEQSLWAGDVFRAPDNFTDASMAIIKPETRVHFYFGWENQGVSSFHV